LRETKNTVLANSDFTERNYSCYCSSIVFSKHFLDISIRFQVRTIKTSKHCALAKVIVSNKTSILKMYTNFAFPCDF